MIYLIIILALIILLAVQHFIFAKREKNLTEFWSEMLDSETACYQTEREKLLDRLMARNFEELKTEEARGKPEETKAEEDNLIPVEDMEDSDWRNVEDDKEVRE